MPGKLYFIFIVLCVICPQGARAQSPDSIEKGRQLLQEVFQTELVYPQEKGEFQVTIAPRFNRNRGERTTEIPVSLEYGITDRWQIEIEWDAYNRIRPGNLEPTNEGIGDVDISTKYSFLNIGGSNFHSALTFELQIPAGDIERGLTEGFLEYKPSASFAKDFPSLRRLQVFSQVGVNLKQRIKKPQKKDDVEPAAHEFILNGGVFVPYKKARFIGEVNWTTNQWSSRGSHSELYLTPGFVYKLPGAWEAGVGIPIGISRDADKIGTILKLVFEF